MAFNKSALHIALANVFSSMNDGDNSKFSNGIANAIVTFVASGDVSTTDGGTIPTGSYVASGTGKLAVTATSCANKIKNACDLMTDEQHGNNYLAEQIGAGIKQMADDGQVTTTVSGTVTLPNGGTVPNYTGSATGSISCNASDLISSLKNVFKAMYDNKDDTSYNGNSELAKEMANAINSFWTSGSVSTNGQGNIQGSSGSGSIA